MLQISQSSKANAYISIAKMQKWKMPERKMQHKIIGVENARKQPELK